MKEENIEQKTNMSSMDNFDFKKERRGRRQKEKGKKQKT